MTTLLTICYTLVGVALLFALLRMIKGPRIFDRLIALDAIAVCFVAFMALLSIQWESVFFIDVILVFSLLNFIGTVVFVSYLNKKYRSSKDNDF